MAISTEVPTAQTRAVGRYSPAIARALAPDRLVWVVVLLGTLLRVYHLNALSLWLDEGITVWAARFDWPTVLGLHGAYEVHPPLYFIVTKAFTVVLPELDAGRAVSLVAGMLTLFVVYALVAELASKWVALTSTLVLALSPVHVWYSQEARMYTLVTLLVALSYLAAVKYYKDPAARKGWAVVYGASVLLALYADYSAIYALAPQFVLLVVITARLRRQAVWLWVAGALACLGFGAWLPQLLGAMTQWGTSRASYLGISLDRLVQSAASLTGVGGNGSYYYIATSDYLKTPWEMGGAVKLLVVAVTAATALLGALTLARKAPMALLVSMLLVGTVAVTAILSILSPGYAERTVLPAVVGWAILVGGVAELAVSRRPLNWLRAACVVLVLALSAVTLLSIYGYAAKQQWKQLAAATAATRVTGLPLVLYPALAEPLITVYEPSVRDLGYTLLDAGAPLPANLQPQSGARAFWLSYLESTGIDDLRKQIAASGYELLSHDYFYYPLYLDLYVQRGKTLGKEIQINGTFAGANTGATGWSLPSSGVSFAPGDSGGRQLTISREQADESGATIAVRAAPNALYISEFDVKAQLQSGSVRTYVVCANDKGHWTTHSAEGLGLKNVANDGQWHHVRQAVLCPADTSQVVVNLRNAGVGDVSFRDVQLWALGNK